MFNDVILTNQLTNLFFANKMFIKLVHCEIFKKILFIRSCKNTLMAYIIHSSERVNIKKIMLLVMIAGQQSRNVWCAKRRDSSEVSRDLCNEALEPPSHQECAPEPCAPQWTVTDWEPCSQTCGKGGSQNRQVRMFHSGPGLKCP